MHLQGVLAALVFVLLGWHLIQLNLILIFAQLRLLYLLSKAGILQDVVQPAVAILLPHLLDFQLPKLHLPLSLMLVPWRFLFDDFRLVFYNLRKLVNFCSFNRQNPAVAVESKSAQCRLVLFNSDRLFLSCLLLVCLNAFESLLLLIVFLLELPLSH